MPRDEDVFEDLDAKLDALDSPTSEEVYRETIFYDGDMVAAAAVQRAINGGGGGGGGGSQPIQTGATKPTGVVTPTGIGYLYVDTTNGAVYIAVGATNADWISLGGLGSQEVAGLYLLSLAGSLGLLGGRADTPLSGSVVLSDSYTQYNGNSLGVTWEGNGTDGQQQLEVHLGSAGQFLFKFLANGVFDIAQASGVKFPTSDPHVAGAWWDDAGTLTKSSG